MIRKSLVVFTSALFLAGCVPTAHYSKLDPQRGLVTQASDTANKGARYNAPVLLRIIKETKQLELWKQNKDDSWSKIKSYEICTFSGELGPKKKQGDYQAPEGFYEITAGQLNPFSSQYLALNTGFPNKYDRAHSYSGAALMIHGGCSSAGCYAITDPLMEEVYAAVRDAIKGGQKSVQLQIYPYEMGYINMLLHRRNPNYKFWHELKTGWDWFEKNQRPIPVDIKDGKYYVKS
jgi:murein L,D-transpeptidase YafK